MNGTNGITRKLITTILVTLFGGVVTMMTLIFVQDRNDFKEYIKEQRVREELQALRMERITNQVEHEREERIRIDTNIQALWQRYNELNQKVNK